MTNEEILANFDYMLGLINDIGYVSNKVDQALSIMDNMTSIMVDNGYNSVYFGKAKGDLDQFNMYLKKRILEVGTLLAIGNQYISLCISKSYEEDAQFRELMESMSKVYINQQ